MGHFTSLMQFALPEYFKREPGIRSGQKYKSVLKGKVVPCRNPTSENQRGPPLRNGVPPQRQLRSRF